MPKMRRGYVSHDELLRDDYDYETPTAQQILNKTIEYELRKRGDNISPLGGDR